MNFKLFDKSDCRQSLKYLCEQGVFELINDSAWEGEVE